MEARLHKRITAVRRAQENAEEENSSDRDPEVSDGVPTTATGFLTSKKGEYDPTLVAEISEEGFTPVASSSSAKNGDVPKDSAPTGAASDSEEDVKEAASPVSLTSPSKTDMAGKVTFSHTDQHGVVRESTPSGVQGHATGTPSRILNVVRRRSGSQVHRSMSSRTSFNSTPSSAVTLTGLLENMSSVQLAFFSKLDRELDKVEQFYIARETEAKERSAILRTQLTELKDHRRLYHELHSNSIKKWASAILPSSAERSSEAASRKFYQFTGRARRKIQRRPKAEGSREVDLEMDLAAPDGTKTPRTQAREEHTMSKFRLDPDEYQRARKRLKKAVLEYYRGLETLNNYRILNLTGFRKALKKFEKATKIPVQEVYMKEKVDTSAFSSGDIVQQILKDMEDQFAARFARGDKKRAMVRLRALSSHKSHHYSTFRTGLALGLAIPAFAYGLYESESVASMLIVR
ncbi:SPX domain-containing protein [Amylostereum chailletii]|nr:SPX domain-containing protein [Amylostereum chailletii]